MKSRPYLLTYLFALVIGVLLLVFAGRTNLFAGIVIAIGILFMVPSIVLIVNALIPAKNADGTKTPKPWYMAAIGIAGLIFGVLLVCMPDVFIQYTVYTLGLALILFGLVQIINLSAAASAAGRMSFGFYVMPWLTFLCGIAVLILGPARLEHIIIVLTGIFLICYSINGIWEIMAMRKQIRNSRNRPLRNDMRKV